MLLFVALTILERAVGAAHDDSAVLLESSPRNAASFQLEEPRFLRRGAARGCQSVFSDDLDGFEVFIVVGPIRRLALRLDVKSAVLVREGRVELQLELVTLHFEQMRVVHRVFLK